MPGSILMLIVFAITNHDVFHWTHEYLYDKSDPRYDYVIDGKKAYLNLPFFLGKDGFLSWNMVSVLCTDIKTCC